MAAPTVVGTAAFSRYTNPLSHTLGALANFALGVAGFSNASGETLAATRATVGAMSTLNGAYSGNPGVRLLLASQVNPTTGAQDYEATVTGAGECYGLGVCSLAGVDTAAPLGTEVFNSGSGTAMSCGPVTGDADDLMLAAVVWWGGGVLTAGMDETIIGQHTQDSRSVAILSKAGGASVSFAPSIDVSSVWMLMAVPVHGEAAGGSIALEEDSGCCLPIWPD